MALSRLSQLACACLLTTGGVFAANAQNDPAATAAAAEYVRLTQSWVDGAMSVAQSSGPSPLKMEVVFGALDSRLHLSPCNRVEPYLPTGTRLWGRSRVGLRCLEGAVRWNVFLPVTVKAYGKAWVLNSNINGGTVLSANDAHEAEVDWAEDASAVVADPSQWIGQTASRLLASGQAIRQSSVRASTAFTAGSQVRVVAQGKGFSVSSDGQAITSGIVGQPARVRMEGGRIVSGLVVDQNTVRMDL